jgi:hypothetical protein
MGTKYRSKAIRSLEGFRNQTAKIERWTGVQVVRPGPYHNRAKTLANTQALPDWSRGPGSVWWVHWKQAQVICAATVGQMETARQRAIMYHEVVHAAWHKEPDLSKEDPVFLGVETALHLRLSTRWSLGSWLRSSWSILSEYLEAADIHGLTWGGMSVMGYELSPKQLNQFLDYCTAEALREGIIRKALEPVDVFAPMREAVLCRVKRDRKKGLWLQLKGHT